MSTPGEDVCARERHHRRSCSFLLVPESGYDWCQPHEVCQLLAAARGDWARTVMLVALHMGVRMGEQQAVRWSDVDFEHRIVTIWRSAPKWLSIEKNPKSNRYCK